MLLSPRRATAVRAAKLSGGGLPPGRLYFSDFGLALSDRFDLSDQERAFLREHRSYDRDYTAAHLVNHHVAERVRGERNRRRFVRAWAAGDRPRDVPASAAAILTRHAGTTVILNDFHQSLMQRSKQTPYPRAGLERIRARASQREDFTTDIA